MKIGIKLKFIITGSVTLILSVVILVILHNNHPMEANIHQEMEKANLSNSNSINKPFPNKANNISISIEKRGLAGEGKQSEKDNKSTSNSDLSEPISSVIIAEKTPSELLKKYNSILSSPEFMAESRKILVNSKIEQIEFEKKIKELENKEKELESSLANTIIDKKSDIEYELEKTKNELLETKIELTKKIILMDDAYQKLKLRYITIDEIRIAQQEIKKTQSLFPITGNSGDENEMDTMVREEALRRLKSEGWVSNPLRSYQ